MVPRRLLKQIPHPAAVPKRSYTKPVLTTFGRLADLTRGRSGNKLDTCSASAHDNSVKCP